MTISDAASEYFQTLFPGKRSRFQTLDPELAEIYLNFSYDEVLEHTGEIDTKTRLMATLAALIATPAQVFYDVMLEAALAVGVTPVEVKEIIYQSIPYVGMGKAYDVLERTNKVMLKRDDKMPLPGQSTTSTQQEREEKGKEAIAAIFGQESADGFLDAVPADQRHIRQMLLDNCFGDIYTRAGIDLKTRELLTFVMLVAQGGCDPQVRAHVQGNLTVGNDRALLIAMVTQLLPFIGYPRVLNGLAAINEVTGED